MLKLATLDDLDLVMSMAMKFAESTDLGKHTDRASIEALVRSFLSSPQEEKIIILHGEVGFIAGLVQPFMLGSVNLATEFAWWVDPEHRKKKVGKELVEAFEFWAVNVAHAKLISLACYDDEVGTFYEKNGYRLYERAYMKEV